MRSLEMVIYLIIAVFIGGAFLAFVFDFPLLGFSRDIQDDLKGDHAAAFRVDELGFYREALAFWKKNMWSDHQDVLLLNVQGTGTIDKEVFFSRIKNQNLCLTLQSRAYGCGEREDVVMGRFEMPSVVRLTYVNQTLIITPGAGLPLGNRSLQVLMAEFGGFEGLGTLRKQIGPLPQDMSGATLELDMIAGSDFGLFINGAECANLEISGKRDYWDLSGCAPLLAPGLNYLEMRFRSPDIFRNYVAGGLAIVTYDSAVPAQPAFYLPEINGSINYFGSIDSDAGQISLDLNYFVGPLDNSSMLVYLNDALVFEDQVSAGMVSRQLSLPAAEGTNLLRIGVVSNQSDSMEISIPVPVDAVLVSDVSGSMGWPLTDEEEYGVDRGCTDPALFDTDTMKLALARCFSQDFARILLSGFSQNRVGLISFSRTVISAHTLELTNDLNLVYQILTRYGPIEGTCVACGIHHARLMLQPSEREKAIVIMTDGVANVVEQDVPGSDPEEQAYEIALEAFEQDGIHLYTIAFGDDFNADLLQRIACIDNCSHFGQGNDAAELQRIYEMFAEGLVMRQTVKTTHVQGAKQRDLVRSELLASDIDTAPPPAAGQTTVYVFSEAEVPGTFLLPSGLNIAGAHLLSWAGTLWTNYVAVNGEAVLDSDYGMSYSLIGDPFSIRIPAGLLRDTNTVAAKATDIEGSESDLGSATIRYSVVQNTAGSHSLGCHWLIQFSDGAEEMSVPADYVGDNECFHTPGRIYHNPDDRFQAAVAAVLAGLDHDSDGVVDGKISRMYVAG